MVGGLWPLLVLVPLMGMKSRYFFFTVAIASYLRASRVMNAREVLDQIQQYRQEATERGLKMSSNPSKGG